MLCWCRAAYLVADPSPRFLLHGTAGSFKKFGLDPQEPTLVAGGKVPRIGDDEEWLQEKEEHWGTLTVAPVPADPANLMKSTVKTVCGDYRCYYANVRDAVQGKAKLSVSSEEGFTVVRLLELARLSSKEQRTVEV